MTLPRPYHAAIALEQRLGDPHGQHAVISFRNALRSDEGETFPQALIDELNAIGLQRAFVPTRWGGDFSSSETFMAIGRVLARRDMNVAVTYSTLLWSTLAWIGGDATQCQRMAQAILAGQFPCLAYSEATHGADLLANELRAKLQTTGRYTVTGQKWPINRATRSDWVVLLAHTGPDMGMRNQSLFLVDKAQLDTERFAHLPRVPTLGLRCCDISGIEFTDCELPPDSLLGTPGQGLELALKGFQVTRTFCTALSLGVNDTALRLVTRFAQRRHVHGHSVAHLPHARDRLANAHASMLMAEAVAIVAARGLHLFTEQFSSWSSVAKVQVSHLCDQAIAQVAPVLGARQYMRDVEQDGVGMFQKCVRDGGIVSIFDGSNIVCQDMLATFLPELAKDGRPPLPPEQVRALFDLNAPLPALDHGRLRLSGRGQDSVMQSMPVLLAQASAFGSLAPFNATLATEWRALQADVQAHARQQQRTTSWRNPASAFALVERYLAVHTQLACLGLWLYNRDTLGSFFKEGHWLMAALQRKGQAAFTMGALPTARVDALCEQLLSQASNAEMFSLLPWPLAGGNAEPQGLSSHLAGVNDDHGLAA